MTPSLRAGRALALTLLLPLAACEADDAANPTTEVASSDAVAEPTSTVTVDYRGTLPDGAVFDEGDGITFSLLQVIPGFQSNIAGMSVGETKTFVVPPADGYGDNPPPGIPPDTDLTFEVTLREVR